MRRSGELAWARSLAVATALACVAVVTSTSAEADYSYTFSVSGINDGISGPITGSFTANALLSNSNYPTLTSGSYNFTKDGVTYSGNNVAGYLGQSFLRFDASGASSSLVFSNYGLVAFTDNTISSTVQVNAISTSGSSGFGLFEAMLNSGPSGSGGGGGSGSGGAPSPEVNASLGLLLAGATFVFLRRKRGDRHEATTA